MCRELRYLVTKLVNSNKLAIADTYFIKPYRSFANGVNKVRDEPVVDVSLADFGTGGRGCDRAIFHN